MVEQRNHLKQEGTTEGFNEEWITLNEAVNCGKYSDLAKTHKGFNPFINEGYLEAKIKLKGTKQKITYLKRSELDNLLNVANTLENNYMIEKEVAKSLGFEGNNPVAGTKRRKQVIDALITFCDAEGIEYRYFNNSFKGGYLFVNKSELNQFLHTHIRHSDAYEKYNIDYAGICSLEKRFGFKKKTVSRMLYFYLIEDAERYFTQAEAKVYSEIQLLEKLDISLATWFSIRKEENLNPVVRERKNHFLKNEVDSLLEKINEIKNIYCTSEEVMDILNLLYIPLQKLDTYPTTSLMNAALGKVGRRTAFLREDVYKYKKELEERELINQAHENDSLIAFELILDIKNITFTDKSRYTEKEWYIYCKEKLLLTTSQPHNLRALINTFIDCTSKLARLTTEKELYSLHSAEINLNLFNHSILKNSQCTLYSFLLEFHSNVKRVAARENTKLKTFNVNKIVNPYLYKAKEQHKEIYSYEEYTEIYNYSKIEEHKHRALLDAENIITGTENMQHYSSAWLYVLIHLCNAWRHSDVLSLSGVDLYEIKVHSLETLKERDLTPAEASIIVNQISRRTLTVNKTGATNQFFCPDDLLLPIATAAVICTLIINNAKKLNDDAIISFGTKNNDFISSKSHGEFFKDFKNQENGFRFKSLQMNRTVLVLIYMVLVKKGHGSSALKLAQRLRAHEDFETSNIYLQIPQEELDELCKSLFNRKHFGFITDLLADVLLGETPDRNERTQEIIALNKRFGGIQKIEATTGYVNKVLSERQLVADKIFSMGFDEATNLMFDLNVNALPSRQENVQCIVASNGCLRPELDNCMDCPYSVPNFLAISILIDNVKSAIKEFIEEYEPSCFEAEKTRLLNHLFIDMDNFERAIQKFGHTEVFKFFEGGEEEYDELLNLLDNLDLEEDFVRYLTYTPIFLS